MESRHFIQMSEQPARPRKAACTPLRYTRCRRQTCDRLQQSVSVQAQTSFTADPLRENPEELTS